MAIQPLRGLHKRTVLLRPEEDHLSYQENPGEPSRRVLAQSQLELNSVTFSPSSTERWDLNAHLDLVERREGNSGETEIPETHLVLTISVMGKEVSLLTGLVGRDMRLSGEIPERVQSYEQILRENQELRDRYEDLVFQLEEARSAVERVRDGHHLPTRMIR